LPAAAEFSTRECIAGNLGPAPQAVYVIPAMTQVTLLTFGFALNSTSNAIFGAQIFFPDATSQTYGNTARFDLVVDGSDAGRFPTEIQYYTRTPQYPQGTVTLRAFYAGLTQTTPGNDHILTLVVNNTSANVFVVTGAYANALFVDTAEPYTGMYNNHPQPVTGSTYTTIGQITIPAGTTGDLFYVSSHVRASSPNFMKFRYLVNGLVTEVKEVNFLNADNGTTVNWLISSAVANQIVTLQALTGSGSGSVTVLEMAGQAMPAYSTVGYLQTATSTGSAVGPTYIPITASAVFTNGSATTTPNAASLSGPAAFGGGKAACMWGTTDASLSISPANAEAQLHLQLLYGPAPNYPTGIYGGTDFGLLSISPDATYSGYTQDSDFGCGGPLASGDVYALQQGVQNLCTGGTIPTWTNTHQRLQMVMLPAPCMEGTNCNETWPGGATGSACDLDNQTCTASTRAAYLSNTIPYQSGCCTTWAPPPVGCTAVVTCPHQCEINLTASTTLKSEPGYCS
jgi:hypothetical protein